MKTLISVGFILLFIISCGSSSKKTYTLTNDNNGTKSPRLKEIIKKTADNNKSNETITRYTYNKQNLLVSYKTSYTQKQPEDQYSQDIGEITYSYTKHKRLKTEDYTDLSIPFNHYGYGREYIYSDIISKKTKLPVIDRITLNFREGSCTYEHTYILDASNFATSLDKIHKICKYSVNFPPIDNPDYLPEFLADEDEIKIYTTDLSKHTEKHSYFSQSAIATYDKGLLRSVEYYSPDETNASKEPVLTSTDEYIYENKPYFFKEYLSPMVFLPH